jgi:hypothetical protein
MRRSIVLLAALVLAACDLPTEPPRWEQTWVVPGERVTIGIADLLPAGVAVSADGSRFQVHTTEVEVGATLGELCEPCRPLHGLSAPKPAFTHTMSGVSALPADLVAAVVADGTLQLTLAHDLGFDPLRPNADPGAERGHVVVTLTSGGTVVAWDSISGNDVAFPSGVPLASFLPLRPGPVAGQVDLVVWLVSPAGDPVEIRLGRELSATVHRSLVSLTEATIRATDLSVASPATRLGFDLDDAVLERIQGGAIRLDVQNPFTLSGDVELGFATAAGTIARSVTLEPGTGQRRLEFSGPELRGILRDDAVQVTATGTLASPGGTLTVSPAQELSLRLRFELTLLVGSLEG